MADFNTHVSGGTVTAFIVAVMSYAMSWTSSIYMIFVVFLTTIVASFMPDMDSKSGLPVRIVFGLYSFIAATLIFYFVFESNMPIIVMIIAPVFVFLIVRYVIAAIFKKLTVHRGMFHSVPAIGIAFFMTLTIVKTFNMPAISPFPDLDRFIIAFAAAMGYLCHLILDEIWATTFLTGNPTKKKSSRPRNQPLQKRINTWIKEFKRERLQTKKSFGTALKLRSKNMIEDVFTYGLLILFFVISLLLYDFKQIFAVL